MTSQQAGPLTVSFTLDIEVDERQWAASFDAGDAYDRSEAQARRSLVADVESYVLTALQGSAAAADGAIVGVDIARDEPRPTIAQAGPFIVTHRESREQYERRRAQDPDAFQRQGVFYREAFATADALRRAPALRELSTLARRARDLRISTAREIQQHVDGIGRSGGSITLPNGDVIEVEATRGDLLFVQLSDEAQMKVLAEGRGTERYRELTVAVWNTEHGIGIEVRGAMSVPRSSPAGQNDLRAAAERALEICEDAAAMRCSCAGYHTCSGCQKRIPERAAEAADALRAALSGPTSTPTRSRRRR